MKWTELKYLYYAKYKLALPSLLLCDVQLFNIVFYINKIFWSGLVLFGKKKKKQNQTHKTINTTRVTQALVSINKDFMLSLLLPLSHVIEF